ncbi:hypothetical protein LTR97_011468 [Elasticomyces elasticus]|uniref:F-box domain-containing protein n=1 Tax=Elasticomyces elasticus TaxID=574655 RepID=A0AAN7ZZU4_9PEZI|nr:hypothetical protein LTR97_011468 [Elasticomyces elasticus]
MPGISAPPEWGMDFTSTVHTHAEGPTDPKNNKVHSKFVAVVTGAGKGLGYHIALAYAKAGAHGIIIASRTQSDLTKLEKEIKTVNPDTIVLAQTCDTQSDEDVKKLADATKAKFGRLDVVVANAGIISKYLKDEDGKERLPVGIVEDTDFDRVINTNFMGSYRVAKYFVPQLIETKDGPQVYICITSLAGHTSSSDLTPVAYNLSKIGNNRMVQHIHNDHKKEGVQAFAVHPGAVLTPQTENHHTTQLGTDWTNLLTDDVALCGGFLTWLTKEKREWLSGRYLSVNWDVDELIAKKDEIVEGDKLVMKMVVADIKRIIGIVFMNDFDEYEGYARGRRPCNLPDHSSAGSPDSGRRHSHEDEHSDGAMTSLQDRAPSPVDEASPATSEEAIEHAYLDVAKADQCSPVATVNTDELIDVLKYQLRLARGLMGLKHPANTADNGAALLATCQVNLKLITQFLTNTLEFDPLATLPSEYSGELAEKVFGIPELAEMILLQLPTADLFRAMQTCKTLAEARNSPQASPKILARLGFRPHPNSRWFSIFTSRISDMEARTLKGYPQHVGKNQLVRRFFCDNVATKTAWDRAIGSGNITVRAKFTEGRDWRQMPLPVVGARFRSMLICQPPIKEMSVLASCCRRLHTAETAEAAPKISNATGLTVGDLYDATVDHAQRHMECVHAYSNHYDEETGTVNATITFEGLLQLQPGDPQLPQQNNPGLYEGLYEDEDKDDLDRADEPNQHPHCYTESCKLQRRLARYIRYKREAYSSGERIVTMPEYLDGYTNCLWVDDDPQELAWRNGYYYDRDQPRESGW